MEGYDEFLLTVRRDVNCLKDADRMVRRSAIIRLEKTLVSNRRANQDFVKRFFLGDLHKPLFRCFADQTEKCRELSILMTRQMVDFLTLAELENILPLLLAALLGRLRTIPFPEQSEELRLELLKLLSHLCTIGQEKLRPFAGDVIEGLSKALSDTGPDAKKECCDITKKLAQDFDGERLAQGGAPLVAALLANLRHNQWRVRSATLDCLGVFLSVEAAMFEHMEEALPHLHLLLADRTPGVRKCLSQVLELWLAKGLSFNEQKVIAFDDDGGPCGFAKLESRILLLLLGVVADEDVAQVAPMALAGIERTAEAKHLARGKEASAAFARETARRKMKEAKAKAQDADTTADIESTPSAAPDLEVAPTFDYTVVRSLLPEPFVSGPAPSKLSTTLVQLHLPVLLPQILGNLTQWTAEIRGSAARLLRVVLVLANRQVAPFLDQLLVHLYKAAADDDRSVSQAVLQCAGMLGSFLDMDLILALVGKHLGLKGADAQPTKGGLGVEELWPQKRTGRQLTRTVQDTSVGVKHFIASSLENKRQVFVVLRHLLRPAPPELCPTDVATVVRFLEEGAQSEELLSWVFGSCQSLLSAGVGQCCTEWTRIFDLLLRMRSGTECDSAAVDASMDELASLCGSSRRQLYEKHLGTRLAELLPGSDKVLWDEGDSKRHVLETLLRNAGSASAERIAELVPVLSRQACPDDASVSARIDLLGLVHFLIGDEDPILSEAVRKNSASILRLVLVPNCTWRAGQSNNKIRKGGMVCMHALLKRHAISAAELNVSFVDLLPILKSALDDSWSPDNRMIACLILCSTLEELQGEISGDQLREVYPELLKRLDDSNDKIRVAVCEALTTFFRCLPPNWSRSLFEYILRTLFVHLDDPNVEIQQGIYKVLETAVHQDHETFLVEARAAAAKSSHPRLCEELGRLAENLRTVSVDDIEMH